MKVQQFEKEIGGRKLVIETGHFAAQAHGAVTVRYGDTVILATVVKGKEPRPGIDYFPLMVDYDEKMYAAGKIKGSRFIKREGKPSDDAILSGRLVDRPLRPLFDGRTREDVQIVVTTLSYDGVNDPETIAITGASAAVMLSEIPFRGPVAAVRIGLIEGELVLNATTEAREKSVLDLVIAGTKDSVVMVEAGAKVVSEDKMLEAIKFAQKHIRVIVELQEEMMTALDKTPAESAFTEDEDLRAKINEKFAIELQGALAIKAKKERYEAKDRVWEKIAEMLAADYDEKIVGEKKEFAFRYFEDIISRVMREQIFTKEERIDGRKLDEIRPLEIEVGILPRTHGTGMFKRGETQVLTVATLGAPGEEQIVDTMEEETKKRYMHHYNFPSYSVGEVRPNRGPSRRDIGHGALAERALLPVLPDKEKFPYIIRLVSEVLESNGSSSMASTCGSSLALMDAGVPIAAPVAGIAMGLMVKDKDYKILTDIQGEEDHLGDMDFKITGTAEGITGMQMDIKVSGISTDMMNAALAQAKKARLEILEAMKSKIAEPRADLSPYAPRVTTLKIKPDKIRDVIGTGGKVINEIIDKTGVKIEIEDDGTVYIAGTEAEKVKEAVQLVEQIANDPEIGKIYKGKVTRIMDCGAIVELWPGKDGMVHISELAPYRVAQVTDILKEGDQVEVTVEKLGEDGKISLSKKHADALQGRIKLPEKKFNDRRPS